MMCIFPVSLHRRGKSISVPCGQCIACRLNRQSIWILRLSQEAESCDDTSYITLTYNDESLPEDSIISKRDCQLFIKKLRKQMYPIKKLKYFISGEMDSSGVREKNPHYHGIFYNISTDTADKVMVEKTWKNGFVCHKRADQQSMAYCTKYILKKGNWCLMSKGLGLGFAKFRLDKYQTDGFIKWKGKKFAIPRYYDKKSNVLDVAISKGKRRYRHNEALRKKALMLCQEEYEYWNDRQHERYQKEKNLIARQEKK